MKGQLWGLTGGGPSEVTDHAISNVMHPVMWAGNSGTNTEVKTAVEMTARRVGFLISCTM